MVGIDFSAVLYTNNTCSAYTNATLSLFDEGDK